MAPERLVGTSAKPNDSINNAANANTDTCSAGTAAGSDSASIPDSTTVTESGGGAIAASDWWGVGAFLFELLFGCVNHSRVDFISHFGTNG
jgi:hypothetical protein